MRRACRGQGVCIAHTREQVARRPWVQSVRRLRSSSMPSSVSAAASRHDANADALLDHAAKRLEAAHPYPVAQALAQPPCVLRHMLLQRTARREPDELEVEQLGQRQAAPPPPANDHLVPRQPGRRAGKRSIAAPPHRPRRRRCRCRSGRHARRRRCRRSVALRGRPTGGGATTGSCSARRAGAPSWPRYCTAAARGPAGRRRSRPVRRAAVPSAGAPPAHGAAACDRPRWASRPAWRAAAVACPVHLPSPERAGWRKRASCAFVLRRR